MRGLLRLCWLVLWVDGGWVGVVFWGWRGCDVVFFLEVGVERGVSDVVRLYDMDVKKTRVLVV